MYITETERVNYIVSTAAKTGMTKEQILRNEIAQWSNSPIRKDMITGQRYYCDDMDVMQKARRNPNLRNNRLQHGFIRKLVDQKTDYLLSKPFSIQTIRKDYLQLLDVVFDKKLRRQIKRLGTEAINKGIAWLQIYFDQNKLCFKVIPSEQVCPLWRDDEHTTLDGIIRVYDRIEYEGSIKHLVRHVEYWSCDGAEYYIDYGGALIPDVERENHSHFEWNGKPYNWTRVPFVPFKYNDDEFPIIKGLKPLIDDYNYQKSTIADLLSDIPNFIYVLKNYGGQDLGEFLRDLRQTNAIKTEGDGGVDKLQADIDTTAFEAYQKISRKDIYEFGRGVDTQNEDIGNASGVALKFRYADLDMDANALETEFAAGLEQMLWFINQYFAMTGRGEYSDETVEFIFNRDIIINEAEAIADCQNSIGIISDKTIISNHPWITNVDEEIKQLQAEKQEEDDYHKLGGGAYDDA